MRGGACRGWVGGRWLGRGLRAPFMRAYALPRSRSGTASTPRRPAAGRTGRPPRRPGDRASPHRAALAEGHGEGADEGVARGGGVHGGDLRGGHGDGLGAPGRVQAAGRAEGDDDLGDQVEQGDGRRARVGEAGEGGGLVLVGDQQVDGGEEFGRQRLGGGRGEDRTDAVAAGGPRAGEDRGAAGISSWRSRASAEAMRPSSPGARWSTVPLAPGIDDDRVAALVVDDDVRGAGWALDGAQVVGVDAGVFEGGAQLGAEVVGADRADHRDRAARAGRGDRLVGALAAGDRAELPAGDGLSALRGLGDVGDEVHVRAAEHGDVGHGRVASEVSRGERVRER